MPSANRSCRGGGRRGFTPGKTPVHRGATRAVPEAPASLACASVCCGRKPGHQEMNPRRQCENMPTATAPPYKTRVNTKQNKKKKSCCFPSELTPLCLLSCFARDLIVIFLFYATRSPVRPMPCQRRGKITKPHVCGGAVILWDCPEHLSL